MKPNLLDPYENWQRQRSDKQLRDSTIAGLRAGANAQSHTSEIERREWLKRAQDYLESAIKYRASALKEISGCRNVSPAEKERWSQCLEKIDLTSPQAGADLKDVLEAVEKEKRIWSKPSFELPSWLSSTIGTLNLDNPRPMRLKKPAFTGQYTDSFVERVNQREKDLELERQLAESQLGSIASSLQIVITDHKGYLQALAHSRR